jgi:hypothetical protein
MNGQHLAIVDTLRSLNRHSSRLLSLLRQTDPALLPEIFRQPAILAELKEMAGLNLAVTEWFHAAYPQAVRAALKQAYDKEGGPCPA